MKGSREKSRLPKIRCKKDAVEYFENNGRIKWLDMQMQRIQSLAWNCDGTRLVCGSQDRKVGLAAVESGGRLKILSCRSAHDDSVDEISCHWTNPALFASASLDRTTILWDSRQDKPAHRVNLRSGALYVTYSPCGSFIACGDKDNRVHLIDTRTTKIVKSHDVKDESNQLAFHPGNRALFIARGSGKIDVLSVSDFTLEHSIQAHSSQAGCVSVAINHCGTTMAVGAADALCSVWSLEDLMCEKTMPRMDYTVRALSWSCDDELLAAGSEDHFIDIAHASDMSRVQELKSEGEVFSLAWHPRQYLLAFAAGAGRGGLRLYGFTS